MPDPGQPRKPRRPQLKPSDWSPRPIPQPAPERRTADPKTPTLKELAARRDVTNITPVSHPAPAPPPPVAEPQTVEAKRARLAQRRALTQRARDRAGAMPPGPERDALLRAATRFEDDTRAVDRARLSQDAYDYYDDESLPPEARPAPPVGYERISSDQDLRQYGLSSKDLDPANSQFRATLYRSLIDPDAKPIVAFRGTIPSSYSDLKNDVQQGVGWPSDYYTRALDVGSKLADYSPGGFETTGHSLGGGLASAVSAAEKVRGDTFNAAGVSQWTLGRVGASRDDAAALVNAYRVDGDALTSVQNWNRAAGHLPFGADARVRDWVDDRILPTSVGRVRTLAAADGASWLGRLNPLRPLSLHKDGNVVASFEQEKGHDSAALQQATSDLGPFSR